LQFTNDLKRGLCDFASIVGFNADISGDEKRQHRNIIHTVLEKRNYTSITILEIIHRPDFCFKGHDVSETGL
jgi:hypothetical protein